MTAARSAAAIRSAQAGSASCIDDGSRTPSQSLSMADGVDVQKARSDPIGAAATPQHAGSSGSAVVASIRLQGRCAACPRVHRGSTPGAQRSEAASRRSRVGARASAPAASRTSTRSRRRADRDVQRLRRPPRTGAGRPSRPISVERRTSSAVSRVDSRNARVSPRVVRAMVRRGSSGGRGTARSSGRCGSDGDASSLGHSGVASGSGEAPNPMPG